MKITRRLETLRHTEHGSTVEIVRALVVCEREQAFLDLGYSSLWIYLVEELKYSQAAASRRYRAMKCASRFPQVIGMLRDHRVSLSSLSKVETLLGKVDDPSALLERICGKSQVQVERIVAAELPRKRRPREIVKRECVRTRVPVGSSGATPDSGLFEGNSFVAEDGPRSGGGAGPATPASPGLPKRARTSAAEVVAEVERAPTEEQLEERVTLRTSLSSERFAALERARAIYSRKNPGATVEELLNELVDHYLAAKAPKKRNAKEGSASGDATKNSRSRHIPAAVRDAVMLRDGERCTFVGKSGHRCSATHNLQIDHILPFALGGDHSPENLRVLCAPHNRHESEKVFGKRTPPRRSSGRDEVQEGASGVASRNPIPA